MYPKSFEEILHHLEKLPSVGSKTAQRYAFAMMKFSNEDLQNFAQACAKLTTIKRCQCCGFLSEDNRCLICESTSRDQNKIMVVAYDQDVIAIEKTNGYHGLYHVLNGVISSSKGVYPEDLNITSLLSRLDHVEEVIIATPFHMDGEMTAMYLDHLLKEKGIYTTRLAHGLPMGASLDYADEWTLLQAMKNRKTFQEGE